MRRLILISLLGSVGLCLVACCLQTTKSTPDFLSTPVQPLDPDNESDAMAYDQLEDALGPVPRVKEKHKVGVVLKFFGNQYWQLLAEGVQAKAEELGLTIDVRAAAMENDPEGQRNIMQEMLNRGYDGFIISPQTDDNLKATTAAAHQVGIPVLVVNEVVRDATHWVGPRHYDSGAIAAEYFKTRLNEGELAVIEGLPSAYAARQRSAGFEATLVDSNLEIVTSIPANWDSQLALDIASNIIAEFPDIRGFYCHNDVMAMGVLAALRSHEASEKILVVGTDGIAPAYDAIRAGTLAATIDSFPATTGEVAVEVMLRLLEGQSVPRVVYSPQKLITQQDIQ